MACTASILAVKAGCVCKYCKGGPSWPLFRASAWSCHAVPQPTWGHHVHMVASVLLKRSAKRVRLQNLIFPSFSVCLTFQSLELLSPLGLGPFRPENRVRLEACASYLCSFMIKGCSFDCDAFGHVSSLFSVAFAFLQVLGCGC